MKNQLGICRSGNLPQADDGSKDRIFRGWLVLAAIVLGGIPVYGIGVYSFYLFVNPIREEFHWSYAISGGLLAAFYFTAPLSLATDFLIRRVGITRIVTVGILMEATALACISGTSQLWEIYLLRGVAGAGKILYFVVLPIVLSKWFSRRFALAVAIMTCGWHFGGVVSAPIAQFLIGALGWRDASLILGLAVAFIALPPTLWMLRVKSAAEIGVGLDGDGPDSLTQRSSAPLLAEATGAAPAARPQARELLQNPAFILMAFATSLYILAYTGVLTLQPTVLESNGSTAVAASAILSSTTAFAALGGLLSGFLLDRFSLRSAIMIQYFLMASGIAALLVYLDVRSVGLLALHAIAFGLAVGGNTPMWITLVKQRLPAKQFQRGWGYWYFLSVAAAVVAPFGGGLVRDLSGTFSATLAIELLMVLVSLPVCLALVRLDATEPFLVSTPN